MTLTALDFSRTRIRASRPISSYSKVRAAWAWWQRCEPSQITKRVLAKRYLDIGCGPNVHPDFVNLDWEWLPGIDVVWDITKGIPLPANHLEGVFTEHTLEHLPMPATLKVLRGVHRVLKPDGIVRVVVPSLEVYIERYLSRAPMPYAQEDRARFVPDLNVYTPAMSVNRIMRFHGHQFIYDFETMRELLKQAGFREIWKVEYRQGREPVLLQRDSAHRAAESLYVEAVKSEH